MIVWVGLGLALGLGILATQGTSVAAEYYAAYFLEKSLSVDNIFVFVIVFAELHVPGRVSAPRASVRHRGRSGVQSGVDWRRHRADRAFQLGHLSLRRTDPVRRVADVVRRDRAERRGRPPATSATTWIARIVHVSPVVHGHDFWRRENGRLVATPLFVALVVIETTDIVFALDSVPAVLAVTRNPLIVYSSNVMAMLGLRSLYFVLSDALQRLRYLRHGLAAILVFTGAKMLANELGPHRRGNIRAGDRRGSGDDGGGVDATGRQDGSGKGRITSAGSSTTCHSAASAIQGWAVTANGDFAPTPTHAACSTTAHGST